MPVTKETVLDELVPLLQEKYGGAGKPPIIRTTNFTDDLGADSLDLVELVMELEDRYGIKIPDDDAQKLKTVGDAVDYIIEHRPDEDEDEDEPLE